MDTVSRKKGGKKKITTVLQTWTQRGIDKEHSEKLETCRHFSDAVTPKGYTSMKIFLICSPPPILSPTFRASKKIKIVFDKVGLTERPQLIKNIKDKIF